MAWRRKKKTRRVVRRRRAATVAKRHRARKRLGRAVPRSVSHYYTVIVPYVQGGTRWHPTESTGPMSKLSRGAFKTKTAARAWAIKHLDGHKYSLKKFGGR